MTTGVDGIIACAANFVYRFAILQQEIDYSMVPNLGDETGVLVEESLRQKDDVSLNPNIYSNIV